MAKTMNLQDLLAKHGNGGATTDGDGKPVVGNLLAETLTCTIQTPDGTVVLKGDMVPRVFGATEKKGKLSSACGWQLVGDVDPDDTSKRQRLVGSYRGLPGRPNVMVFLPFRVEIGESICLRTAEEKASGAFEPESDDS